MKITNHKHQLKYELMDICIIITSHWLYKNGSIIFLKNLAIYENEKKVMKTCDNEILFGLKSLSL